jgi:hypothetical protein
VPTIGDFTSSWSVRAAGAPPAAAGAGAASADAGSAAAIGGGIIAGLGIGAAIGIAPRGGALFDSRSFIPLSEEISMESTVEPSSISISFLT